MAIERFDFPAVGTATESWLPDANPLFTDFVNDVDLGVTAKRSAGNRMYHQGTPVVCNYYRRVYANVAASERASFENFRRVVGGQQFKFTDEYGVAHRVTFVEFAMSFKDNLRDNWGFGFTLREELAPWPSLVLIDYTLQKDLLFYAPLVTGLAAMSRWDGAPSFARASTATYIDPADGLVKTAAAGVPRFEANGLLMEETRINRCLYSEQFNNAAWSKNNVTVTADNTTDPAGGATADLLTATAANASAAQDLGTIASSSKAFSVWLKRKTGTGNVLISLDGFVTSTTVALSSTAWTRFTRVQTLADPDPGIMLVTSGDEVWAWGAQLEDGVTFATSYIPTTSAIVTRNHDALSFASEGNALPERGTVFLSVRPAGFDNSVSRTFLSLDEADGQNFIQLMATASAAWRPRAAQWSGNSAQFDISASAGADDFALGTKKRLAFRWDTGAQALFSSGTSRATATGANPAKLQTVRLGDPLGAAGTNTFFGHLTHLAIFKRALTDTEIGTLNTAFA